MFGVGGGIIMVPLLMLWARMDQRQAAATSLVAIVPTAVAGATTYGIAGEIDLVAVSEDSQSQGVGSALMDSMIDLADNWLDLKRLSLIAFVGNDRAIALYERLGFEREGIMRRVGYGDGDWMDAVMMARLRD